MAINGLSKRHHMNAFVKPIVLVSPIAETINENIKDKNTRRAIT